VSRCWLLGLILIILILAGCSYRVVAGSQTHEGLAGKWRYVDGSQLNWCSLWWGGTETLEFWPEGIVSRTKRILGGVVPELGRYRLLGRQRIGLEFSGLTSGRPVTGPVLYESVTYEVPGHGKELALMDECGTTLRFRKPS
jgi:hypothetical protein